MPQSEQTFSMSSYPLTRTGNSRSGALLFRLPNSNFRSDCFLRDYAVCVENIDKKGILKHMMQPSTGRGNSLTTKDVAGMT